MLWPVIVCYIIGPLLEAMQPIKVGWFDILYDRLLGAGGG
jgi:hypothetical protein